ncbi:SMI1/KNR4 family protein [Paenibacillus sp. GSMTC-2017]|uniref:SMI1/KNR4 family protein n=1 Tax=Paenibacillus sp. GSMTC-2017 TaxID=2794350 RepID=UPI0018D85F40|nr:SMI1/KNR4 family protein [Paenibacillus sp. GSMTC-2017]
MIKEWVHVQAPPTEKDIQAVEQYLDVQFPKDYIACVTTYHGGRPRPSLCKTETDDEAIINQFLSFDPKGDSYILNSKENIQEGLPDGVIPIAATACGDYICFDYYTENTEPIIVLWSHETAPSEYECGSQAEMRNASIFKIADTFDEFLNGLYFSKD